MTGPAPVAEGQLVRVGVEEAARRARRALVRNVTLAALLVGVLGVALDLFVMPPEEGNGRRTTYSTRADGYGAVFELARRLGYRVERHLGSFGSLPRPPDDHALAVIDPLSTVALARVGQATLDAAQRRALFAWIEAGGRLLWVLPGRRALSALGVEVATGPSDDDADEDLAASLLGAPPRVRWASVAGALRGRGPLKDLALHFPRPLPSDARRLAHSLRPLGGEDRLVRSVDTAEQPLGIAVFAGPPGDARVLLELDGAPLAVERAFGRGRIVVVASPYPFTNLAISPRGGAARVAQRLLHVTSEEGRRELLFDEFTHGLRPQRSLFALLWESPVRLVVYAVSLLVGVLGWRGALRLGAARPERLVPRRAKEEFVVSLADLTERAGRARAAARWLLAARRGELPAPAEDARLAALVERIEGAGPFGPEDLLRASRTLDEVAREHLARRGGVRESAALAEVE
ncbi:MAG: DUF4350 domain-containing protein [Planctomycetota bacterium]|nr:MAG: DUF4350 domain-containing protein [Planctomycetota bacterium]